MDLDALIGLLGFAFATSITPGPNNLMLMASGAQFGARRTLPHWAGVSLGFAAMAVAVGLGLAAALDRFPLMETALKILSAAFILFLAWKIANAGDAAATNARTRPLTFFEAALFQWINPKALAMALSAVTLYAADQTIMSIAVVAVAFMLVNLPCVGAWVFAGEKIASHLKGEPRRWFNRAMGALLVLSMAPLLY